MIRHLIALLALLIAMPALAAAPKHPTQAATRDWSQVAVRTPAGTFVQGNSAAKVKLVEYLSFTCPHCAAFEAGAAAPLAANYIRAGLVSYEVRIALRDPFDMAAAVLSRCAGPRPFFAVVPGLYAAQNDWLGKGSTWAQTATGLDAMPPAQALKAIAAGAGLDAFFARRGLAPARQQACFANASEQKLLADGAQAIWSRPGFPGTPAFEINGVPAEGVITWPDLETRLKAALHL